MATCNRCGYNGIFSHGCPAVGSPGEAATLRTQLREAQEERESGRMQIVILEAHRDELEAERDAAIEQAEAAEALVEEAIKLLHQYDRHVMGFSICDQYPCSQMKPRLAPAEAQARQEPPFEDTQADYHRRWHPEGQAQKEDTDEQMS